MPYTLLRSTAVHTTKPAETLKKNFDTVTIFANAISRFGTFGFGTFRKKCLNLAKHWNRDDGCGSSLQKMKTLSSRSATSRYFDLRIIRADMRQKALLFNFAILAFLAIRQSRSHHCFSVYQW